MRYSFMGDDEDDSVFNVDVEGEEWDTLILMEGSKVLKGVVWDETWGDILTIKISRTLDDGGLPNSDWTIEQVLNTFDEDVDLPSDILSIIETYLINERN